MDCSALPGARPPIAAARERGDGARASRAEHEDQAERRDREPESHVAPTSMSNAAGNDDSIDGRLSATSFE
jgi:hypothetical protein